MSEQISQNQLAQKWAWREISANYKSGGMLGVMRGFGIFITAIFLGVFAISLVGSFSESLQSGLNGSGKTLLNADVSVNLRNQFADDDLQKFMQERGTISEVNYFRGMLRDANQADNALLVDAKAVDAVYPHISTLDITQNEVEKKLDREQLSEILAPKDDVYGMLADPALLIRLDIAEGAKVKLGNLDLQILGTIKTEPDRVSAPFSFGPRIIISKEAMMASTLIQTGSIFNQDYKIILNDQSNENDAVFTEQLKEAFPQFVGRIVSKSNAAPNLARITERLSTFLTLISLIILVVGGVGIGNSVKLFIEKKHKSIATFKSIGADSNLILKIYLIQIFMITLIAIALGLLAGAIIPFFTIAAFQDLIPLPLEPSVHLNPLLLATAFGLMISLLFSLIPLAQVDQISPRSLFRSEITNQKAILKPKFLLPILVLLVGLVWLALDMANYSEISQSFIVGIFATFLILRVLGYVVNYAMRLMPRFKRPELRLAVSNLAKPQSPMTTIIISLGLGLTLLVTLSMVEGNIARQLNDNLPDKAPAFFLLDIKKNEVDPLKEQLAKNDKIDSMEIVPLMRGKIVKIRDVDVTKMTISEDQQWVTNGTRGLTYSEELPENSTLVAGEWWPKDYDGPPLVSIANDVAEDFDLKVGEFISINLFGREIRAEISSLRDVEWEGMGINFVMVFSPNTLKAAPHVYMATLTMHEGATVRDEANVQKDIVRTFPTITAIAVRDALEVAYNLTNQLTTVIRISGALTLLTGFLVLGGAIAAGNKNRAYDMVILKALGSTRPRLLSILIAEFLILGLFASMIALVLGSVAAGVILGIMQIDYVFLTERAIWTIVLGTLSVLVLGLIGTWQILGASARKYLQNANNF